MGNRVVDLPAKDSAPSASELPVTRGEPQMDHVQANTSTAAGPSPIQQRTHDDAGARASAELPAANPVTESALSAQDVHDIFVSGDACLVLGGDAKGKERCIRAAVLAKYIVTVPKTSADSWAYGMEYELNRRVTELLGAEDSDAPKRRAVQCNVAGCLVYLEGRGGWAA